MSESPTVRSSDSATPFVDEEQPFKMKWGTLKHIIIACVVGATAVVGYAVNLKLSLTAQGERSERIEVRIKSVEESVGKQTEAMFEQKMNLRLMDQKLDNISRAQAK